MRILLLATFCLSGLWSNGLLAQAPDGNQQPTTMLCDETTPACTHQFVNGHKFKIITSDKAVAMVSLASNGKYTRLEVDYSNTSGTTVDVLPSIFAIRILTPKQKDLEQISPEKILASASHRAAWANALNAAGAGMATQQVNTQTSSSGTVQGSSSDGTYTSGNYSGTATSTTSVPNYAAQAQARENIAARRTALASLGSNLETTSLKANSVLPNKSVRGYVYFKADKHASDLLVELPIGGIVYRFPFTMIAKK